MKLVKQRDAALLKELSSIVIVVNSGKSIERMGINYTSQTQ